MSHDVHINVIDIGKNKGDKWTENNQVINSKLTDIEFTWIFQHATSSKHCDVPHHCIKVTWHPVDQQLQLALITSTWDVMLPLFPPWLQSQSCNKTMKFHLGEWFGKDVSGILVCRYVVCPYLAIFHCLMNKMIAYVNMLCTLVQLVVFWQCDRPLVVRTKFHGLPWHILELWEEGTHQQSLLCCMH